MPDEPSADRPLVRLLSTASREAVAVTAALRRVYYSSFVETRPVVGVHRGIVVALDDPSGGGRMQVSCPSVLGDRTVWASQCLGHVREPVLGDRVWLAFEEGDRDRPVVLGLSS